MENYSLMIHAHSILLRNKCFCKFAHLLAEVAQSVEHQLPKLRVAGSNPVFRSKRSE